MRVADYTVYEVSFLSVQQNPGILNTIHNFVIWIVFVPDCAAKDNCGKYTSRPDWVAYIPCIAVALQHDFLFILYIIASEICNIYVTYDC